MAGILKCYYTEEEVLSKFNIFEGVAGFEDAMKDDTEMEIKSIETALKDKATATILLSNAIRHFYEMMEGKHGYESDLIRAKFTFSKDGKYIQQPGYGNFVEPMIVPEKDSELKMNKTETKYIASARDYSKMGAEVVAGDLSNI